MSRKAPIWDYLNFDNEKIIEDNSEKSNTKKIKKIENKSKLQDSIWLKSLLHPSMEQNFIRLEVESLIYHTSNQIICTIRTTACIYPEYISLLCYLDVWWWKIILSRAEFNVQDEICNAFPFLRRITRRENLIDNTNQIYLLFYGPIVRSDGNDPKKGILACKRFLIIEQST